jgi:hypothetical protein
MTACGSVQTGSVSARADAPAPTLDDAGPPADARPTLDDAGPPADASPRSSACPSTLPSAGSACSINDFVCAYGTNPNPLCNQLSQCIEQTWQTMSGERTCPAPAASCPTRYAAAYGTTCANQDESQLCTYPEGTCVCGYAGKGDGPDEWICTGAATGCPLFLPKLGSPCAAADAFILCNYGGCSAPATTCLGGFWSLYLTGCT